MSKVAVAMLDQVAVSLEGKHRLDLATKVDRVARLLVLAEEDMPEEVTDLADALQQRLSVEPDQALDIAKELFEKFGKHATEEAQKEGIFPLYALPQHERREGPRPQDVPIGEPKFWK